MASGPHPLQEALDRATDATRAVVDLFDIARERKPKEAASGREGRPDARQVSLYKAVIATSVGAIEETFEALLVAGLKGIGVPDAALNRISGAISRSMQSPSPDNLDRLFTDYLKFKPSSYWSAYLMHSPAVNRPVKRADERLDYRYIHTAYTLFREFQNKELSDVLQRFLWIRHSFAHQDSSRAIFTKDEQRLLWELRANKARPGAETSFVESVSTTCAVILNANAQLNEDPLVNWTVHETHAVNALFLYIGLVMSTCSALADDLEDSGVRVSDYDRLVLRVRKGGWREWHTGHSFDTPNVDLEPGTGYGEIR